MDTRYVGYEFAMQNGMWFDVGTGNILTPDSALQLIAEKKRVAESRHRIVGTYAKQLRDFEAAKIYATLETTRGLEVEIVDRWNDTHMAISLKDEKGYYKLASLLEASQIPVHGYTLSIGKSLVTERRFRADVLRTLKTAQADVSYQSREVVEQGWRTSRISTFEHEVSRKGQDRFFQLAQEGVTISLLFDGHGTDTAINYITAHRAEFAELGLLPFPETNAEAFERAQRVFIDFENRLRKGMSDMYSGSTIIAAVHNLATKSVFFAQAGDSRAVWQFEPEGKVFGTSDHKPDDQAERERVTSLGGRITRSKRDVWRVNDNLATSRSFGDETLKERGEDRSKDLVSVIPSVYGPYTFGPGSLYGLGSDGVFDVLSNEKVVRIIRNARGSQNGAQDVTAAAVQAGSHDDITFAYSVVL